MAPRTPWRNLSEMDRSFAESRRAAAARRRAPREPSRAGAAGKAVAVAVIVFAFAGGIVAEAHGPTPRAAEAGAPPEARCPIPREFRPAFAAATRETGVPLSLLTAIAYEESEMNPNARSRMGAVGLLQLMPGTARDLDADATDPDENVRAGAAYMARMLEQFSDDVDLALAAYNAGPAAVEEAGGAPSLETLAYVANVKNRAFHLEGCR